MRPINRCILIVCEGTSTEHKYFQYIAENISIPKKIWSHVEVSDNNTIPSDLSIPAITELGKREKRQFTNPNQKKATNIDILKELYQYHYGDIEGIEKYEKIKAVPLRYVAQAQLIEQEQELYDEIWAVFDKDGHTHHKEAFEKAKTHTNGKFVNIGFSSRSFEQWVLLHFIQSKTAFQETECGERPKVDKKRKGKKTFNCGKNIHEKDCKGETCLVGYIRKNTKLDNYEKSNSKDELKKMMDVLLDETTLHTAFTNSDWLRNEMLMNHQTNGKKIYELNPYTNVDILVKRLLGI